MKNLFTYNDFTNEGVIGILSKIITPKNYKAALAFVKSQLEDDYTKDDITKILSGNIKKWLIKTDIKDESKYMKSIVDEIYKDCKKDK